MYFCHGSISLTFLYCLIWSLHWQIQNTKKKEKTLSHNKLLQKKSLLLEIKLPSKNVHDLSFGGWVILMLEDRTVWGLTKKDVLGPIESKRRQEEFYIASSACKALSWRSSSSSTAVFVVRAARKVFVRTQMNTRVWGRRSNQRTHPLRLSSRLVVDVRVRDPLR